MITAFIIGCEIGFWLFVLAGLFSRYILRMKKLGAWLLFCTPVVDLALLIATIIDLRSGKEATFIHGLAAIYIGVSIAFGHRMIQWADQRFAYLFAKGPEPTKKPKYGAEHARYERIGWLHHFLAWVVGCVLLLGVIWMVQDAGKTEALVKVIRVWSLVLGIDFLISFSYTLFPRKSKETL
ncbi:hypothetical protein BVG16_14040 [Paenibacillus selenitireducens]|uniref:2TM domain-containing protein n=1 Tax=Paenibacillus selenitireducens TaxID=1324314 RepID=A0A1T2XCC5_9BACL|nr:hypothetical protein [Paenibacillus selenitireducens]OPA77564.1 hypothetical protein BVG16_14040 [Paenibacillus selenitireducens]